MSRKPMVTRTFITTKCVVLCMDTVSCKAENKEVTLSKTYSSPEKVLKAVRSLVDTDELKAVKIVSSEEVETLYGMPEDEFIKNALILDKDTRKELATAETTEDAE